ncbi:MAG: DNA-binding protein [Oscillospiraceae bacterium]|nr:DNA-binding protein [Oscillospiraceae bacterium]
MEYRRFGDTVYLRIDRGEEIVEQLGVMARQEHIRLAEVSALGAVDEFTVGVLNVEEQQFHANRFTGYHEIVSLVGSITTMDGAYYSHLHMSAANEQGQVFGGHLNRAVVSATCEMVVRVTEGTVERRHDETTGLNLFHFL